jgi:hypothetical protein
MSLMRQLLSVLLIGLNCFGTMLAKQLHELEHLPVDFV